MCKRVDKRTLAITTGIRRKVLLYLRQHETSGFLEAPHVLIMQRAHRPNKAVSSPSGLHLLNLQTLPPLQTFSWAAQALEPATPSRSLSGRSFARSVRHSGLLARRFVRRRLRFHGGPRT